MPVPPLKRFAQPPQRMILMILEGNLAGDHQFDFGSRGGTAPDAELRANSTRSLAHARKPPMSFAPSTQNLWIDPTTVVAHQ
jgi:hypothetical protein